jgi:hypothetical protein
MSEEIEFLKKRIRALEDANTVTLEECEKLRLSLRQVWNVFSWVEMVEDQARFDAVIRRQVAELSNQQEPHEPHESDSIVAQIADMFMELSPEGQQRCLKTIRSMVHDVPAGEEGISLNQWARLTPDHDHQ